MRTRKPIVAGQFYPGRLDSCVAEIKSALSAIRMGGADLEAATESAGGGLPETIVAGIVPHAGWTFSGSLAALVFFAIKHRHKDVHTFVIFGAAHAYFGSAGGAPAVYDRGSWMTPLGEIAIDEELADAVVSSGTAASDPTAHSSEHSIEVQVPFIQHLFRDAEILPIIVPPNEQAIPLGEAIGDIVPAAGKKVVCIGSSDLTHYGPRYGFTPMGVGKAALQWSTNVNDQQFIDLALKLQPQRLLKSAAENYNACGPGAAAATVAAAKKLGKPKGLLLAHTDSNEVMLRKMGTTSADSVGYAAIVF